MNLITIKNNEASHVFGLLYPDGQRSCKLDLQYFNHKYDTVIKCRIKTFDELELLLCIVKALQKNDYIIKEIQFMYLLGQRSDRVFEQGTPNYFVDVLKPIIDNLNIPYKIYAPHNIRLFKPAQIIKPNYVGNWRRFIGGDDSSYRLFPNVHNSYFVKKRDAEGNIQMHISEELKKVLLWSDEGFSIVDDMCDGGRTFIEAAKLIKPFNKKLSLFVAHGIFSRGFDELLSYYDTIYTTNSYQDFEQLPKNVYIEEVI